MDGVKTLRRLGLSPECNRASALAAFRFCLKCQGSLGMKSGGLRSVDLTVLVHVVVYDAVHTSLSIPDGET